MRGCQISRARRVQSSQAPRSSASMTTHCAITNEATCAIGMKSSSMACNFGPNLAVSAGRVAFKCQQCGGAAVLHCFSSPTPAGQNRLGFSSNQVKGAACFARPPSALTTAHLNSGAWPCHSTTHPRMTPPFHAICKLWPALMAMSHSHFYYYMSVSPPVSSSPQCSTRPSYLP